MSSTSAPTLQDDGYIVASAVVDSEQAESIKQATKHAVVAAAGTRNLLELGWCRDLVERIRSHSSIRPSLPQSPVAVQCTFFDKTEERNWLVALHQDLSIPVKERIEDTRLGVWSQKEGQHFVQAPVELLEQLLAVRVHIDDCGLENGPLRVVPGSHRYGRLGDAGARRLRDIQGEVTCAIASGSALLLRPLLLHASSKATSPRHRRVLHFLFGPQVVGYDLRWQHAV
jgi:ectoine hydroxylase-related dioxygenase (phytanoyl-CoA dioxygenase family)